MTWLAKLSKPNIDKMLTKGDGDGIIRAFVHDSATVRAKAAQAVEEFGLDAFRNLTPSGLAEACAKTSLLVKPGPFDRNWKENVLRFLFFRALLDPDNRVKKQIASCLSSIDARWVMRSLENVDKDAYVALEKMGLTLVPHDMWTHNLPSKPDEQRLANRVAQFRTWLNLGPSDSGRKEPSVKQADERQIVSKVVHQFVEALSHTDFDKIRELVVPELYEAASGDTLNVHLVSIPKRFKVTLKGKQSAVVTGKFDLQLPPTGSPDIVSTTAKFLLMYKAGKWMLYNYSWRDYLLENE